MDKKNLSREEKIAYIQGLSDGFDDGFAFATGKNIASVIKECIVDEEECASLNEEVAAARTAVEQLRDGADKPKNKVFTFLVSPHAFMVTVKGKDRYDAGQNLVDDIEVIVAEGFADKLDCDGFDGEVYFLGEGYFAERIAHVKK